MASGGSKPSSASGAAPSTMRRPGTPSEAAFRAIIAARAGSRSIAIAERPPPARSHSMAIEPQPAPTSHRVSPGNGTSAARVAARTSRLVSWPSCSKTSSGRPARSGNAWAPGPPRHEIAIVLRSGTRRSPQDWASSEMTSSQLPPRWARTVRRLGPQPSPARRSATAQGVPRSSDRISIRRCGARWSRRVSSGRPCKVIVAQSASGQPSREAARLKALGCARIVISSRGKRRVRVTPMPYHIGSPLANTVTLRPRRASIASIVRTRGRSQTMRSASPSATIARWRTPPTSTSAVSTNARAAGARPAIPSSPMPITASQGLTRCSQAH